MCTPALQPVRLTLLLMSYAGVWSGIDGGRVRGRAATPTEPRSAMRGDAECGGAASWVAY